MRRTIELLQEFSIPLIAGVVVALFWANLALESYHHVMEQEILFGYNLHFLVNDVFMVFFFAIAAVEITQSVMPGGALNPMKKAINPLLATVGGVLGPVAVYLVLNNVIGSSELVRGWGIPTATDIALAWLVARFVFGAAHPAVKFLLLLAIADDAIGLIIIAVFYPDPLQPTEPVWLLLVLAAVAVAFVLRKLNVNNYWPYLLTAGVMSWYGMHSAHLHPALALVVVIPFLPHPVRDPGELFEFEGDDGDHSALAEFEHEWKVIVDFGLFFFGLTNAGVVFSAVGPATWLVFSGLLIGKTVGIYFFANLARLLRFPFPDGMGQKEVLVAGVVAGVGLTVALFVAGAAFVDADIQAAAKMGALLSGAIAILAFTLGKVLQIEKINEEETAAEAH